MTGEINIDEALDEYLTKFDGREISLTERRAFLALWEEREGSQYRACLEEHIEADIDARKLVKTQRQDLAQRAGYNPN